MDSKFAPRKRRPKLLDSIRLIGPRNGGHNACAESQKLELPTEVQVGLNGWLLLTLNSTRDLLAREDLSAKMDPTYLHPTRTLLMQACSR